jgi:signal transduction histidine kinase
MEVNRSFVEQEQGQHTRIIPMSVEPASTKTGQRSNTLDRHLQGRWPLLARVGWGALVVLTLGIFFASLPVYIARRQTLCAGTECTYGVLLTPEQAEVLKGIGLSLSVYAAYTVALTLATMVVCLVVSTVIVWRRSDDRMALLVAFMLVTLGPLSAMVAVLARPSSWQLPAECLVFLALALAVLVFLLFPTGQFVPSFTRWIAIVCLAGLGLSTFFPNAPFTQNPYAISLFYLASLVVVATLALVQLYRYRRISSPLQRQQTKWVVFGLAVPCTFIVGGYGLMIIPALGDPSAPSGASYQLAFAAIGPWMLLFIPLSFGFAILRYRLWDIDVIIKRTIVYGILTACVIGIYVLVVGYLGTLFHTGSNLVISLLATGLVAALFQPLRELLQRGVNRLFYGQRDEPYRVISQLGQRLEATLAPDSVLSTIVETIAQALKLPYSAISLKHDQAFSIVAFYGTEAETLLRVPLMYQTEQVGELLLAPRARGESFTPADRRLLEDLARQVGIAAHAVRLTADLQQSRERLVTAREEERRRLRRDLHDGLGPTLASMTLKLDAARLLLTQNPSGVAPLLVELKAQMRETIVDIRRLVYDLRPPALDELGLLAALREQATQFSQLNGVQVSIEMPDRLPRLSAALEVAIYRIVLEALTNVARHAQAQACCIRLGIADALSLEVSDDGVGLPKNHQTGVGIASMRERAAELGGTCLIESGVTRGTHVLVHLPLAKE